MTLMETDLLIHLCLKLSEKNISMYINWESLSNKFSIAKYGTNTNTKQVRCSAYILIRRYDICSRDTFSKEVLSMVICSSGHLIYT